MKTTTTLGSDDNPIIDPNFLDNHLTKPPNGVEWRRMSTRLLGRRIANSKNDRNAIATILSSLLSGYSERLHSEDPPEIQMDYADGHTA